MFSPFGQFHIVGSPSGTKSLESSQQYYAVGCDREGRLTRHRLGRTNLRISHSQDIFFISMIDFNLPTVKGGLDQRFDRADQIRTQHVGRFPVIDLRMKCEFIRLRRQDDQTQGPCARSTPPEDFPHFLVADRSPGAPKPNRSLSPCKVGILAELLRRKSLLPVLTSLPGFSRKTKTGIFAASCQQFSPFHVSPKDRSIAETTIEGTKHFPMDASSEVQRRAHVTYYLKRLDRKIVVSFGLPIGLPFGFAGPFARLLYRRGLGETYRDCSWIKLAPPIMGKQQRGLDKIAIHKGS